jgi:hypothetical protein
MTEGGSTERRRAYAALLDDDRRARLAAVASGCDAWLAESATWYALRGVLYLDRKSVV